MQMLLIAIIYIICFVCICESQTSYNTGYIVRQKYNDKLCQNPIIIEAVALGQCIYINDQNYNSDFSKNYIISATTTSSSRVGIKGLKYKWDAILGFMPTAFYSDEVCTITDTTKIPSASGIIFEGLNNCTTIGLNSIQLKYYQTYGDALGAVKSIGNYTLTLSYSTADSCKGTSSIPVYMESTKVNYCYTDTSITSAYVECKDKSQPYTQQYSNTKCDSSVSGYTVPEYTYKPSCSSAMRYEVISSESFPRTLPVAGYEISSCGVYTNENIITMEFVLPIAIACFFFALSFCLCLYIFCFLYKGATSPPPRLPKDAYSISSV